MKTKTFFITLEGPEGSGKTSVGQWLTQELKTQGYDVTFTREPGGVDIAEQIREIILNAQNSKMDPWTEALLYIAARKQHIVETILPALTSNKIVICDRYMDSTLVYQGVARNLGVRPLKKIQSVVINGVEPDLTIFFDIDPQIGLERIKTIRSQKELNRLDLEELEFHKKVYEGYQQLIKEEPQRFKTINARKPLNDVCMQVRTLVMKFLEE